MTRATAIAPIASASAVQNAAAIHSQTGLRASITVPPAAAGADPVPQAAKVKGHELGPRSAALGDERAEVVPPRIVRVDLNNLLFAIERLRS